VELEVNLKEAVERYREKRRAETLSKAKSFREFLQWKINFLTVDVCARFGVVWPSIIEYQAFAKKVLRDFIDIALSSTINPSQINIDDIFDYYEKVWAFPRRLDPEIVRELELELIIFFNNIDKLREEYESLTRKDINTNQH